MVCLFFNKIYKTKQKARVNSQKEKENISTILIYDANIGNNREIKITMTNM